MARNFRLNRKGMRALLLSQTAEDAVMPVARRVEAKAIASSPEETGEYKSKFQIDVTRDSERVVVIVKNTSDHSLAVEFGRGDTPRHRILGKALVGNRAR